MNIASNERVAQEQFLAVYPNGWQGNWNDGRNAPPASFLSEKAWTM